MLELGLGLGQWLQCSLPVWRNAWNIETCL